MGNSFLIQELVYLAANALHFLGSYFTYASAIIQVFMGIIVLAQSQFLKFDMPSNTESGVACFLVAILELVILIGLIMYEKWQSRENISR